jgi:hypothetical protein
MKFEVPIVYKGQANYIVTADSPQEADAIAQAKFHRGETPDTLGNEWETIDRVGEIKPVE